MPHVIQLDWATEEGDPVADAQAAATKHNLEFELIALEGPGGGWPLCQFKGDRDDIVQLLADYCDGDEEEVSDLEASIEEVNGD